MGSDFSRETFDPRRNFSSVLMQQGRVQLDADWNELVGIMDRRLRAETTDIIGRCTVPKETPDGFKIDIVDGVLTIGRGRLYVDGLLAENHGKEPLEFDPVLAEQRGSQAVPYNEQPYFPNAAKLAPFQRRQGQHLVYIDVWQREVTYLENPDLVEKAVGVDTTTRLQTVWQVRLLQNVGFNVACSTPDELIPGWVDIIRPSAGRLSTTAVGVSPELDPCKIPPSGGYRGLENRLYRVEIHDGGQGGPQGKATFKWSRDNASIATSVTAISALDELTVARIGRDATLRFSTGDWIEITDDWLEFAQQPGIVRQIKDVKDTTRVIMLNSPLPANTFPTDPQGKTDSARHTRIRRWDQKGKVSDTEGNLLVDLDAPGSSGLIPVPATGTSIVLEDGVQITFATPPEGTTRVGDYWTFTARTADASVEQLQEAPPRGVHHHYCRLAVVTFPDTVTPCRNLWPPECGSEGCECSVCVTAESHNSGTLTIQDAIGRVKASGGTVCLGPGTFYLGESPVQISRARSLCVRGHGPATRLIYRGPGAAVLIEASVAVTVEALAIITPSPPNTPSPAVAVRNSAMVTLQRNVIFRARTAELPTAAIGLGGVLIGTLIRENVIYAPTGVNRLAIKTAARQSLRAAPAQQLAPLLTAGLLVKNNTLACTHHGLNLEGLSMHILQTQLAGNLVIGCLQGGIVMQGWVMGGSSLDVRGNEIHAAGPGIVVGTDEARIDSNTVTPLEAGKGGDGIVLAAVLDKTGLDRCQVLANRITGLAGHGLHLQGIVKSAMIKNNFISGVGGGGIVMDDTGRAGQLTIENNQLLNLAPSAKDEKTPVVAIRLVSTVRAEVVGNAIIGLGNAAEKCPSREGIQVINIGSARIDGNEVLNLGPATDFVKEAVAIECLGTFVRLDVTNNTVRRRIFPPKDLDASLWMAVRIGSPPQAGVFAVNTNISYVAVQQKTYAFHGNTVQVLPRGKEIVGIQGNLLEAYGAGSVIDVVAGGALTLNNNRCLLAVKTQWSKKLSIPVVQAKVGAAIVNANYLQGPAGTPAMTLQLPQSGPFTVLGNITSGAIKVNDEDLTAPWAPLNVVAS